MDKKNTMEIVRICLDIMLIIIGIWLIFFKSYASEKGKNLATKEDIGKITEQVESVKREFNKKIVNDKNDIELNNELYNALNDFYNLLLTAHSRNASQMESFGNDFEEKKNKIEQLFNFHYLTYYKQYQALSNRLTNHVNLYIEASRENNQEESLKQLNLLKKNIEAYKIAIYDYLNN